MVWVVCGFYDENISKTVILAFINTAKCGNDLIKNEEKKTNK